MRGQKLPGGDMKVDALKPFFFILICLSLAECIGKGPHFTLDHEEAGAGGVPGAPGVESGAGVSTMGGSSFADSETYTAITSLNTFGFRGVSEGEKYISSDPITELQINILSEVTAAPE